MMKTGFLCQFYARSIIVRSIRILRTLSSKTANTTWYMGRSHLTRVNAWLDSDIGTGDLLLAL